MNLRRWLLLVSTAFLLLIVGTAMAQAQNTQNQPRADYDCNAQSDMPVSECEALVALYNSTGGDNWANKTGWLQTNTPCSWEGVSCLSGSIYSLYFSSNRLTGALPAEIGQLTELQLLDLSYNSVTALPLEFGSLSSLSWLWMPGNKLTSLPEQFGNLTELTTINLQENNLQSLPSTIGGLKKLEYLSLTNNQINTLPAGIGGLSSLNKLYLDVNNLTVLPAEIGNLTQLSEFYLSGNNLQTLQPEIGGLVNLTYLALGGNVNLGGEIPPELGNLKYLGQLDLSNRNFVGEIPPELGNMSNLETLYLSGNNLTGSIPATLGNLVNLTELDLSNNGLSGTLPSSIGNLVNLSTLGLSGNDQLSGEIPTSIGNLTGLSSLVINANLTGSIPSTIGNLVNLTELNLSENALEGEIPATIGNLNKLTSLNLRDNALTGAIPSNMGNMSSLKTLTLDNNLLTGTVPATLANTPLQTLDLQYNQLDDFGAIMPSLQTVNVRYNKIEPSLTIGGWLASLDVDWYKYQVYPPKSLQADFSNYETEGSIRIHWVPDGVSAFDELFCATSSGVTESNYAFTQKVQTANTNELYLIGYPDGTYYCKVRSFLGSLASRLGDEMYFIIDGAVPPANDQFANAVKIGNYTNSSIFSYAYSASMVNANRESAEPTPSCVNLNGATARSVYFSMEDGGPFDPNIYGELITKLEATNTGSTRITIGVYTGDSLANLQEVACATGAEGSSTMMNLFSEKGKDYTIIVWADEPSGVLNNSPASQFTLDANQLSLELFLYNDTTWCEQSTVYLDQCDALATFYNALGGQQWVSSTDNFGADPWLRFYDVCQWHGITCGIDELGNQTVTGIDLSNQGLHGELPDVFAILNDLTIFDISDNWVYGDIPYSLIALTFLNDLDFSYNTFDTTDPDIAEFIGRYDPDWQETQTIVANGSFEGNKIKGVPVVWSGNNNTIPGKDKQKCNKDKNGDGFIDKFVAYEGSCALMFKGNSNGTRSKIKQVVYSINQMKQGTQVTWSVYIDPRTAPAGTVFSKFIIKYSDGNKSVAKLRVPNATDYTQVSDTLTVDLINGRLIDKVKIDFRYAHTTGKFFVDDASLTIRQTGAFVEAENIQRAPDMNTLDLPIPPEFRD